MSALIELDSDRPAEDPLPILERWLSDGSDGSQLMTLATVGRDGRPDARTLMLSGFDRHGLRFHTNRETRKVEELAANTAATAVLAWPLLGRQLIVSGTVSETDPAEQAESFRARSRYLQVLSWVNTPENAALPRGERERIWAEYDAAHPDTVPVSPHWWGGRLSLERIVFWQGSTVRSSIRVEYSRRGDAWNAEIRPG